MRRSGSRSSQTPPREAAAAARDGRGVNAGQDSPIWGAVSGSASHSPHGSSSRSCVSALQLLEAPWWGGNGRRAHRLVEGDRICGVLGDPAADKVGAQVAGVALPVVRPAAREQRAARGRRQSTPSMCAPVDSGSGALPPSGPHMWVVAKSIPGCSWFRIKSWPAFIGQAGLPGSTGGLAASS